MENKEKIVFETFRKPGSYEIRSLTAEEPRSFNGFVEFRKYRITIEPIEEPQEVLEERLQKLWDECDNHHQYEPLRNAARRIRYELQGSPGTKKKK